MLTVGCAVAAVVKSSKRRGGLPGLDHKNVRRLVLDYNAFRADFREAAPHESQGCRPKVVHQPELASMSLVMKCLTSPAALTQQEQGFCKKILYLLETTQVQQELPGATNLYPNYM